MQHGIVVTHASPGSEDDHERATHRAIAQTLAALQGFAFGGEYDASARYGSPLYFVPGDTLLAGQAEALGIRTENDLFGGVVPFPFIATKAIVHPLVAPDAQAPEGWSQAFARRVCEHALPGFAAFSIDDARRGALRLLAQGAVRLKPGDGVGGHGQAVVRSPEELEGALERLDRARLARFGLAVELDLLDATVYSLGQVRVGSVQASYCGTQFTTTDNQGRTVFGGSDLLVLRGGYDAVAALPLTPELRQALGQAQAFDAATEEFPGFFASRRNYDAVAGRDRAGRRRSGILEQSWRIGGASGPEVAALAALRADPGLRAVRARSTEAYGTSAAPPGAIVHYRGVDRRVGMLTKYTVVRAHEAAQ
jgi:hypothetical protein